QLQNTSGEQHIEVLLELSGQLRRSDVDSAMAYARRALAESQQMANENLRAESHRMLGWLLGTHDSPEALKHFLQAKELFEQIGNLQKEAATLINMGHLYRSQSNFKKALEYYFSALNLEEQLNDQQGIGVVLNWIGISNQQMDRPEKSIRFYKRALKISELAGNNADIAEYATNLGAAYGSTGETNLAVKAFKKALEAAEDLPGAHARASILMSMSSVYNDKKAYQQALDANKQALALARSMSDKMLEALALGNIAMVYRDQDKFSEANTYLLQALPLLNAIGWQRKMTGVQNRLAQNLLSQGAVGKAVEMGQKALARAQSQGSLEENRDALETLAEAYIRQGDYRRAYESQRKLATVKDSLHDKEREKQIAQMQARYETQQKEQEIALLQKKQEKAKLIRYIFIAGLVLTVLIGLLVYNRQRLKIRKNRTELENTRLKEQRLKQDLEFKNKQLTTHSLHLVQKNESMKELKEHIGDLRNMQDGNRHQALQKLKNMVDYSFNLDEDWEQFKLYFEEVHTGFFDALKKQYPDLTANELRLSALVKLNLTSKEIATILGITADSVKTARYRLRKKLDMATEENLTEFMMKVEKKVSNIE
ncbi:MAG TPA: tetratricopeptide repeat protein, partial [Fodinibius sp.]|nr:tetratricopeptide repeat protein [Fodinibius sp.]